MLPTSHTPTTVHDANHSSVTLSGETTAIGTPLDAPIDGTIFLNDGTKFTPSQTPSTPTKDLDDHQRHLSAALKRTLVSLDPDEEPQNKPLLEKWIIVCVICSAAVCVTCASSIVSRPFL